MAQGRPRAAKMGKGVRLYDPPKSKIYKEIVKRISEGHMRRNDLKPFTEALRVDLEFYFMPPKSYSRKRINAIYEGEELYTKKPDADNLAKAVTDAMNGVVYNDDAQITVMTISKDYSNRDYVKVRVRNIESLQGGGKYYE